ncbi:MAG: hypothetical protein Q7U47_01435 [Paludibacter sp.]|nr:hypothetical protein [Paludibacter sp.]
MEKNENDKREDDNIPNDIIEKELIVYLRKQHKSEEYINSIINDDTKKYAIWSFLKSGGKI